MLSKLRTSASAPLGGTHLSMSPTTKNIDPKIATMSAKSCPLITSPRHAMLLNDAERNFNRHGVFSPRDTM